MNLRRRTTVLTAAALLSSGTAWAQTPWLHVRVEEPAKDTRVHVNLPMNVVHAAMALAPERLIENGRIRLHHGHDQLKLSDLRRVWKELKNAGDAEFVSVKDRDESVSVRRRGDRVLVDVEKARDGEKVKIEVPVSVVDALFSNDSLELDLKAATAELQKLRGDIVKVDGRDGSVRVWIDEKN
jgi:hypothetical protein